MVIGLDLGCCLLGRTGLPPVPHAQAARPADCPGDAPAEAVEGEAAGGGGAGAAKAEAGSSLASAGSAVAGLGSRWGLGGGGGEDTEGGAPRPALSGARIAEISFECLADDVPFDETEMARWPEAMVYAYFENVSASAWRRGGWAACVGEGGGKGEVHQVGGAGQEVVARGHA
jgi:hypothetical protein